MRQSSAIFGGGYKICRCGDDRQFINVQRSRAFRSDTKSMATSADARPKLSRKESKTSATALAPSVSSEMVENHFMVDWSVSAWLSKPILRNNAAVVQQPLRS
jgi:hypothetical protein